MELRFPIIPKPKRKQGIPIVWTDKMLDELTARFPTDFNKDIAKSLGVSWRSVVRKARQLGLQKTPDFLEVKRPEIVKKILKVRKPNPKQCGKGFVIPNSEQYRFKPGNIPPQVNNPELVKQIHAKRNASIARDRIRVKYGLPPLTKLKIKY